jgi:hypothetical protein
MNKFYVGSEVIFQGNRGVVRAHDSYREEEIYYWEYAVEFDDPEGMENLWGCIGPDSETEIISKGNGAWIMEEDLEQA